MQYQAKSVSEVYSALVEAGVIDAVAQPVPPMGVADAYEALVAVESPSDVQLRLLYECALLLNRAGFRGLANAALETLVSLSASHQNFDWRPEDDNPDIPETI